MNTQEKVKQSQQIATYSIFDTDQIGKMLACLISDYEGIPYQYQTAWHNTSMKDENGINMQITNDVVIILPKSKAKPYYSDDDFIEANDIFVLQKDKQPAIQFYQSFGCIAYPRIELKSFSYIEEFLERIIAYKIKHQTDTVPEEIIKQIKQQFLRERIMQIQLNHKVREQQEIEESRRLFEQDKKTRQYQLQKF